MTKTEWAQALVATHVHAVAGRGRSKAAVSMLLDAVGVGEAPDSPAHHTADGAQASEAAGLDRAGDATDEAPSLLDELLSLSAADHASPTLEGGPKGEAPVSLAWLSLIVTAVYRLSVEANGACYCTVRTELSGLSAPVKACMHCSLVHKEPGALQQRGQMFLTSLLLRALCASSH